MGSIFVVLYAFLMQLPMHLLFAWPWLLALVVICILGRNVSPRWPIVALATGVGAVGTTPIFGFHLSMAPMLGLVRDHVISVREAPLPFLITWAVLFGVLHVSWRRSASPVGRA